MTKRKIPVVVERTEICRECRHAHFGKDVITCRRYPPEQVFDINEGENISSFPIVVAEIWCGEFAPKLSS